MRCEWKDCTLGDAITLKRGYDLPAKERRLGTVPIVSSAGVSDFHSDAMVKGPGVVTGRYGTIGQVFYLSQDFWPLNTTLYVQDFKGNDRRFVSYLLRTVDYHRFSDKAAVPGVNRNHLHTARIALPPLAEQERIAEVLQSLDDRIDLLRQTNATLEAIAQALFKSWFVDFDPVQAKMEGREPEGMDATTAALFPDGFEESELGLIPRGWRTYTFGEIATLGKGTVNPSAQSQTVFQHYSLPAFDAGQMPIAETGEAIKSNKTSVSPGTVLVSKLNPHIPRVWFVGESGENAVCSTEFLVWMPRPGIGSAFVYFVATSPEFNTTMRQLVTGTSNSHQRVRPDQLAQAHAAAASEASIAAFDKTTAPLLQRIEHNRQQAATLAALRDALLPRLISGKLRLPDHREQVEEAAA